MSARIRHCSGRAALTCLIVLCGCQQPAEVSVAAAPLEERLEFGFDLDGTDPDWLPGDRVVYALETFDGEHTERFYLRYSILDRSDDAAWPAGAQRRVRLNITGQVQKRRYSRPVSTALLPATLEWLDHNGAPISDGTILIAFEQLDAGLYAALRSFREGVKQGLWAAQDEASYEAGVAAFTEIGARVVAFQRTFEQRPSHRILRHVTMKVIRPTWLQMLAGMRSLTLRWGRYPPIAQATQVNVEDQAFPGMICAISHELGSSPVSIARLKVIDTTPPWHLCGGVIAVDGHAISAPHRTYTARVVAIRRGPPNAAASATEP